MKFLVVGLGSMGKRRIRNLQYLKQSEIIGFDLNEDRCKESSTKYGIQTFQDIKSSLNENPQVMVISTPPDLHMKYAYVAIENNLHFFTEASVIQDDMQEIIEKLKNSKIIGLPSCTMRYHPMIKKIKEIIENEKIGKILSFMYHSGQYLPDWHPWEDYRKLYFSKRETGACREIVPFELIWIQSIFGDIKSIAAKKAKVSDLEADIDDIYNVLLEFKNGIQATLTVDVIVRYPFRQLKILGQKGVVLADWIEHSIKIYSVDDGWTNIKMDEGKVEKDYINAEEPYIEEMDNFIKSINNEIKIPYTFEEDLKILKILEKIEDSNDQKTSKTI